VGAATSDPAAEVDAEAGVGTASMVGIWEGNAGPCAGEGREEQAVRGSLGGGGRHARPEL
jgi:hypothetical protein